MFRNKHKTSQYYFQCLSWQFASVLQGDWWLGQTDSTCRHPVVCFLSGLWWCLVRGYVLVFSVNTVMWCREGWNQHTGACLAPCLITMFQGVCRLQTASSQQQIPWRNCGGDVNKYRSAWPIISLRSVTIDTQTHRTHYSCWLTGRITRKIHSPG